MKHLRVLFLVGYALSGGVADAATYYVSKSGSNANSCATAQSTTQSSEKLTIVAGVACLSAGDTLLVHAGTYAEAITSTPSGTSWSNKVRIANYNGEVVWLIPGSGTENVVRLQTDEHYVEFDGINMNGANTNAAAFAVVFFGPTQPHHIRYQNAEVIARTTDPGTFWSASVVEIAAKTPTVTGGIELLHLTIHGGGRPGSTNPDNGYGIYMSAPNNLIDGCDIYDNKGAGIEVFNDDGALPANTIIRNNRIHNETRWGVGGQNQGILLTSSNNQVYNNLIYNNSAGSDPGDAAIAVAGSGNKVWNNTIYNTKNGIYLDAGASNTEVKNNIVYVSQGSNFVAGGHTTIQSNNLFGVDPLFVNRSANDFRLQAVSPAVNAGAVVSSVTTDFAGLPRPQGPMPDIGAYEFDAGTVAGESGPPSAPLGLRILGAK